MYEVKTKVNDASVRKFLDGVSDENKRKDSFVLLEMMRKATGKEPKMWGTSIVGFDSYHYRGKSSEGEWYRDFHLAFKLLHCMRWVTGNPIKNSLKNWENIRWVRDVCTSSAWRMWIETF